MPAAHWRSRRPDSAPTQGYDASSPVGASLGDPRKAAVLSGHQKSDSVRGQSGRDTVVSASVQQALVSCPSGLCGYLYPAASLAQ